MLDSININIKIDADNKCSLCTNSLCCNYFTQKIETPRSKYDFDCLLWQISHQDINIYKDGKEWYLLVRNKCEHLIEPGGLCNIYERRPDICREYKNDFCEYDQPVDEGYELYFNNYKELRAYCKKRFKRWDR